MRTAADRKNFDAANSCFLLPLLTSSITYGLPAANVRSFGVKDISLSSTLTVAALASHVSFAASMYSPAFFRYASSANTAGAAARGLAPVF